MPYFLVHILVGPKQFQVCSRPGYLNAFSLNHQKNVAANRVVFFAGNRLLQALKVDFNVGKFRAKTLELTLPMVNAYTHISVAVWASSCSNFNSCVNMLDRKRIKIARWVGLWFQLLLPLVGI